MSWSFCLVAASIECQEAIIGVDEKIAVEGEVRWAVDLEHPGSYRQVGKRMILIAGEEGSIRVSDDPSTFR